MPPTVQNTSSIKQIAEKRRPKPDDRKSELLCNIKYCNTLPDLPHDLKFIPYPFDPDRIFRYKATSLERSYRFDIIPNSDLGVSIDLINPDVYAIDHNAVLHPDDERLLEEDLLVPQDSKRSQHHAKSIAWLRRTEYISTEQTRFQPQTMDKVEAKVGYRIKKNRKDETLYMDRHAQMKAIEKTFEDAKLNIKKHYSKPNVVPVEIVPIYPDFALWKHSCAQVIFDSDPAPVGKQVPAQIEEMSQAMIRGAKDASDEEFVAYFLPTQETLTKRRDDITNKVLYQDDENYEYKMAREYNWNVKSKASTGYEENYFFVERDDGLYYSELETRVRLSKRRQKAGQALSNTRLIVKHRSMNTTENMMQLYREKQLQPLGEDNDGEEKEVAMELDQNQDEVGEDNANNEDKMRKAEDIQVESEDIQVALEDIQVESKDIQVESKDIQVESKDIQVESEDSQDESDDSQDESEHEKQDESDNEKSDSSDTSSSSSGSDSSTRSSSRSKSISRSRSRSISGSKKSVSRSSSESSDSAFRF